VAKSTVIVPKPQYISYGEAMSRLRIWLDSRKLRTSAFRLVTDPGSGFEITFESEEVALRFQSEFSWPPPRALSGEPTAGESPSP